MNQVSWQLIDRSGKDS